MLRACPGSSRGRVDQRSLTRPQFSPGGSPAIRVLGGAPASPGAGRSLSLTRFSVRANHGTDVSNILRSRDRRSVPMQESKDTSPRAGCGSSAIPQTGHYTGAKFGQASQETTWAGLFHFPRESAAGSGANSRLTISCSAASEASPLKSRVGRRSRAGSRRPTPGAVRRSLRLRKCLRKWILR